MPKATPATTTPPCEVATPKPASAFNAADWIEQMSTWRDPHGREDLPEATHPDEDLLVIAERTLGLMSALDAEYKAPVPAGRDAQLAYARGLSEMSAEVRTMLRRASKIRAQTPEGIYAKAQLVSRSRSGSPILAKSLAADMIEMPGLRRLLWPAEVL